MLGSQKSHITNLGTLAYSGKNGLLSKKPSVLWLSTLKQSLSGDLFRLLPPVFKPPSWSHISLLEVL